MNIVELCKIIKILKRTYFGLLPSFVYFGSVKFPQMSDFSQSPKLKYISKIWRLCEILWKDTGHFGLFKTPTLRLREAGKTQTQSQT